MSVDDDLDGWTRLLLRIRGGAPAPATQNAAALSAEMLDRGNAGGWGLIGPNTVLGVENSEEGAMAQVLVVDLGRGAAEVLTLDADDSGVMWDGGHEPDMMQLMTSVEAWLCQGTGSRVSDYLTADEGAPDAFPPRPLGAGVEELPIGTPPWA